ncbi:hypothetical protein V6N12_026092 [Hibiscus sabdariffa]|uniref:Uncharacterized protein n=1 Tax=Hibiscus sabdariffa TaxID=183260 RepID=A0ABR2DR85_9ROSI
MVTMMEKSALLSPNEIQLGSSRERPAKKVNVMESDDTSAEGTNDAKMKDPKAEDEVFGKDVIHLNDEQADEGKDAPVKSCSCKEIAQKIGRMFFG